MHRYAPTFTLLCVSSQKSTIPDHVFRELGFRDARTQAEVASALVQEVQHLVIDGLDVLCRVNAIRTDPHFVYLAAQRLSVLQLWFTFNADCNWLFMPLLYRDFDTEFLPRIDIIDGRRHAEWENLRSQCHGLMGRCQDFADKLMQT